jgi:ferredoxin
MRVELELNPIACDAHGMCAELFPEAITLDDWGYPLIADRPIGAGEFEHAKRAVDACPTLALRLRAVEQARHRRRPD